MTKQKQTSHQKARGGGEQGEAGGKASPGVIGGAALVGAGVGALLSGPFLAIGLGAAAAGLCLRDDQVGQKRCISFNSTRRGVRF